jgi:3-phenylpropionate/cinnamic acid dioxygenase small subunit
MSGGGIDVEHLVGRLILDSAMLIDREEFEAWTDCFDEESSYMVIPRENRVLGLPAAIIRCDSKAILRDRISVLRHANKYNPHYDKHFVNGARILSISNDIVSSETNFMIVQTSKTGVSRLFCVGCYEDRIRVSGGEAKFVERVAVLDTFSIQTLMATPV